MEAKFFENYELKKHSTFKIGGYAKKCFFPETVEELISILKTSENYIILGNASNVLISSFGVEEDVIFTTKLTQYEFKNDILTTQAGVKMPLLTRLAQGQSLSGLEYAIGFPATVGGAIFMNAGAHGQSTSDIFVSVQVFNQKTKQVQTLTKEQMCFGYRHSVLQDSQLILLSATFQLTEMPKDSITERIEKNLAFRKEKQPSLQMPNAGSIFRNPEQNSAGALLDKAGVKNFKVNDAKVYENHANFIVNTGNATSSDVIKLMTEMQKAVKQEFNIELKSEIKYIGNISEEEKELWTLLSNQQ